MCQQPHKRSVLNVSSQTVRKNDDARLCHLDAIQTVFIANLRLDLLQCLSTLGLLMELKIWIVLRETIDLQIFIRAFVTYAQPTTFFLFQGVLLP